eukprot:CAMPEP_0171151178 /NCGR_PEP_ID=MMETSP0766_2-20121228/149940_1 /TAXON_ID=439317 /ORGANISM="Gambierdiscus australes, Strain CAWD 149" /LENGTH=72 /DNA_ID=CAMNT_0011615091 /DNA_START=1273 /DNA_END=1489 /DNA_ORIENTATION=-
MEAPSRAVGTQQHRSSPRSSAHMLAIAALSSSVGSLAVLGASARFPAQARTTAWRIQKGCPKKSALQAIWLE